MITSRNNPVKERFKVLLVYANSPMDNLMPVSVSSIAGALKKGGIDVRLFDTTYYKSHGMATGGGERSGSLHVSDVDYSSIGLKLKTTDVFDDFRKMAIKYGPDLIGVSTVETTHLLGLKLLECIRDLNIPTIMGGVHTIFSPTEVINEDVVDMVCIGEGEKSILELCEEMKNGNDYKNIKNIWVKSNGKLYKNDKADLDDLNGLPELDFSIFEEQRRYRPMAGHLYRMAPVEFSRGCMFKCTFCSAPTLASTFKEQGRWLRYKSISKIIKEIKAYIADYNIEYFYFVSETFLAMPEEMFEEFCHAYSKIAVPFWFNTRPETISFKRIKMLEDIGCHRMSVGVESGNEEYRKKMLQRNISNSRIVDACKIVSSSSIQLSVNNIVGFPDETIEMMFDTIYLNRQIDADSYSCSILQPYRGTSLYEYCVKKGYYDPNQLAIDLNVDSPLNQPHITSKEIRGIARTFPLYVKFPETEFDTIKKAGMLTSEGDSLFEKLSEVYFKRYMK